MTDNLRIWNALEKTNPEHTKGFKRSGGFSGTAIKPIYTARRMTEQFGPCGTGWGMDEPTFQVVNAPSEILVFCTVGLWYREPDSEKPGRVYGVGGDKVLIQQSSGPRTNDEAFKASYTDAISNAMKQIGMSADVHMGLFDDEKYVREMKAEFSGDHPPAGRQEAPPRAATGAQKPSNVTNLPPKRNEKFFARESYEIKPVSLDENRADWVKWCGWIAAAAADCLTKAELVKLDVDNARHFQNCQMDDVDIHRNARAHITDRHQFLETTAPVSSAG